MKWESKEVGLWTKEQRRRGRVGQTPRLLECVARGKIDGKEIQLQRRCLPWGLLGCGWWVAIQLETNWWGEINLHLMPGVRFEFALLLFLITFIRLICCWGCGNGRKGKVSIQRPDDHGLEVGGLFFEIFLIRQCFHPQFFHFSL